MATNEELIGYARALKEFCGSRAGCDGCPLTDKQGVCFCKMEGLVGMTTVPCNWRIPTPRRFTDTDILWAKAAKASGAVYVVKHKDLCRAYNVIYDYVCDLPGNLFSGAEINDCITLDDILKEEEV